MARSHTRRAAVVLAAGGSRRMGTPKGLLELGGVPLLSHHVARLSGWADTCIVVVGADARRYRPHLPPSVRTVHNPAWRTTQPIDSLRLALDVLADVEALWVTPLDVPPARAATLEALAERGPPAVPVGPDGAPGHPVLLGRRELEAVRAGDLAEGLRTALQGAPRVAVVDPFVAVDFDGPEAWHRFAAGWSG